MKSASGQSDNPVAIKKERDKILVTVRIGKVTILKILLDTGFAYDGMIIYNPSYRDPLLLLERPSMKFALPKGLVKKQSEPA